MLVVVEGLDGSGKSTQVRRLKEYLENTVGELEYIHFPRYDAEVYGELISRFLRGDLLFAEDRRDASATIRGWLEEGRTVLLDRYVYSNIAYQCAKLEDAEQREALREWILHTEYGSFGLPSPDINIFLDVPVAFVEQKLSGGRNGCDRNYLEGGRDIHEADMSFQKTVRQIYLHQCELDSHFIRVDCSSAEGEMLPPDEIFARIMDCVAPLYLK